MVSTGATYMVGGSSRGVMEMCVQEMIRNFSKAM